MCGLGGYEKTPGATVIGMAVPGLSGARKVLRTLARSDRSAAQRAALALAIVGPCGLSPVAPATLGSAVGTMAAWATASASLWMSVGAAVLLTLLAVWTGGVAEEALGAKDPAAVTIDEVVGAYLAGLFVAGTWPGVILSFAAFRITDTLKPAPAQQLQAWPGGWGIVADDVVAGVYAHLVTRLALWWLG